jgi:hypothetical protein
VIVRPQGSVQCLSAFVPEVWPVATSAIAACSEVAAPANSVGPLPIEGRHPGWPRIQKGKDAMASTSPFQQYLSPTDMTMLDRVLKKVCVRNSIPGGSADAEHVAALLIRKFQHGANTETNLMTARWRRRFQTEVPVSRLIQLMGNALYGWEGDGGTAASISPSKELIPWGISTDCQPSRPSGSWRFFSSP